MNDVRNYLQRYRLQLYLIFYIPQLVCVSWGMGAGDSLYRVVFVVGIPFLLLSMAGERYTPGEWICMCLVTTLVIWAYVQNRNRSLILACMAAYGTKNLNLKSILRYILWISAAVVAVKVLLSGIGILPNEVVYLPKGEAWHIISCYGFSTPNNLYFHLVILVLLVMVLYGGRLGTKIDIALWLSSAVVMYGAYRILMSRSGWMCALLLLILYGSMMFLTKRKALRVLDRGMMILTAGPSVLCVLNWCAVYLYGKGWEGAELLNTLLTGRLHLAWQACSSYGIHLLGSRGAFQLDMLYISMLFNYGWILSVICMAAYTKAMWYLYRQREYLLLIAMLVLAVYSFVEVNAVNPIWNPFLLYIASPLFGSKGEGKGMIAYAKDTTLFF